jgi:hypothetical protein
MMSTLTHSSTEEKADGGQALVEVLVIMIICLMIGVGIYEAGAFFHNVAVMNSAVESAATVASHGAPFRKVERIVVRESKNLLAGAFLSQYIPEKGVIVEVWNPVSGNQLAPTQHADQFHPGEPFVAEAMFRARGYEVRVGVIYRIGITMPFLQPIVVEQTIVGTRTIQSPNDIDRDGMVDSQEAALLQSCTGNSWSHPVHRDQQNTLDAESGADIDGDGLAGGSDSLPYDFNNNGIEDRMDEDNRQGPRENDLIFNPVVGPNDWSSLPGCSI